METVAIKIENDSSLVSGSERLERIKSMWGTMLDSECMKGFQLKISLSDFARFDSGIDRVELH